MLDKIMILFLVAMNSIAIAFLYFSFKFHIENFKESLGFNREIREANHSYLLERIRRIENELSDIKGFQRDGLGYPASGKPVITCCTEYLEDKK